MNTNEEHDRPTVELSLLVIRLVVGTIFAIHGAQKVFGVLDGPGLTAFVEGMEKGGTQKVVAYLVAIGECFGGLGLVIGFLSRFSALSLIVIMGGAIQMVHGKHGFFLKDGGFEYNLALIGLLVPIFLAGPGSISIGRLFLPRSALTGRPIVFLE